MRLSKLQQYILLKALARRGQKIERGIFLDFYKNKKSVAKAELHTKIITRSLENLIDKELMIGYGLRTSQKWFIHQVQLTSRGKRLARKLLGEQMRLPFRKK